jgi:hypothetical protein
MILRSRWVSVVPGLVPLTDINRSGTFLPPPGRSLMTCKVHRSSGRQRQVRNVLLWHPFLPDSQNFCRRTDVRSLEICFHTKRQLRAVASGRLQADGHLAEEVSRSARRPYGTSQFESTRSILLGLISFTLSFQREKVITHLSWRLSKGPLSDTGNPVSYSTGKRRLLYRRLSPSEQRNFTVTTMLSLLLQMAGTPTRSQ